MAGNTRVCDGWPVDSGGRCLDLVRTAARDVDVPAGIRDDTGLLFEQSVLQNAEPYRRRAIDTLRAGGCAGPAARGLAALLHTGETPSWLRCRALFALGFLQERGEVARQALVEAYRRAQ